MSHSPLDVGILVGLHVGMSWTGAACRLQEPQELVVTVDSFEGHQIASRIDISEILIDRLVGSWEELEKLKSHTKSVKLKSAKLTVIFLSRSSALHHKDNLTKHQKSQNFQHSTPLAKPTLTSSFTSTASLIS